MGIARDVIGEALTMIVSTRSNHVFVETGARERRAALAAAGAQLQIKACTTDKIYAPAHFH